MKQTPSITDTCRFIYEEKGQSAVFDYVNKLSARAKKDMGVTWEHCKACDCESPAYRHSCLVCGQKTTVIKRGWYRIKENVEYSVDFKFFAENQARLVKSGNKYTFCSRLEAKTFRSERALFGNNEFSEEQLLSAWKEIHKEILEGKHGQGELVY